MNQTERVAYPAEGMRRGTSTLLAHVEHRANIQQAVGAGPDKAEGDRQKLYAKMIHCYHSH